MKTGAVQSVKFMRLKRRLKINHWQAVGILEALWLITQTNAPRGDIGRLGNEDIAAMIEWNDDADELIDALVDCGWLDRHPEFRLLVHDWHIHCPSYIRGALTSQGVGFAVSEVEAKQGGLAQGLAIHLAPGLAQGLAQGLSPPLPNLTKRNLTEPNQTKPNNPVRSGAPLGPGEPGGSDPEEDFRQWPELVDLAGSDPYPRPESAGSLSHRGIFAPLKDRHLSEPGSLREWLIKQSAAPAPCLEATPQSLVAVLALAEHVRSIPEQRIKKNRIAVFVNLASRQRWSAGRPFVHAAIEQLQKLSNKEALNPELCTT